MHLHRCNLKGKVSLMKFNKKAVFAFLIAVILVISSFGNVLAQEETAPQEETKPEFSPVQLKYAIARVASQIASNYYYGVEDADLLYRALCSAIDNGSFDFDMAVERMMKALADEYSEFYPAERFEQVITDISGEFFGIGVSITLSDEHVVVVSVFPGSPAEKTGILPYDLIVSVDGQSIKGMSTAEVAALIKREKNSKVDLGIVRNGVPMTINCYCDEVDQNPVSYEIMEDGKIGYIYISNFTLNLDEFIVPILNEFNEKGIKDIILDIRNNGGGELNAAVSLANHFIPEGTIAKFKYKNPEYNQDLTVTNGLKENPYNMVLLVNENSASASELFAGAVKDRDAGAVIGTLTYGKGSMQTISSLMTGSAIKFTVAEFHSPNDTRIHEVGITPEYHVKNRSYPVPEEEFSKAIFNNMGSLEDGEHILAIEQRLEVLGCFDGEPDMVYDEDTKEAIMYFQMLKGLEITGVADVYTAVALNDVEYDFEIVVDDQIEAAKQFLLTGNIDEYIYVEEAEEVPTEVPTEAETSVTE